MPRRLALYSDQIPPLTDALDEVVRGWLPRGATIGYLPAGPDRDRCWFGDRSEYYARYGLQTRFFGLEDEFDPSRVEELFSLPAIHLTGGNTFRFLYWLYTRGLFDDLKRYVAEGGVLIGVSAGAILMTPEVDTSILCGDIPYEGIRGGHGLSLVDFAIVPHDDDSPEFTRALQDYSRRFEGTVYGIPDGAGILVDGEHVELVGDIRAFSRGTTLS